MLNSYVLKQMLENAWMNKENKTSGNKLNHFCAKDKSFSKLDVYQAVVVTATHQI